jgi:hypothetical protein
LASWLWSKYNWVGWLQNGRIQWLSSPFSTSLYSSYNQYFVVGCCKNHEDHYMYTTRSKCVNTGQYR